MNENPFRFFTTAQTSHPAFPLLSSRFHSSHIINYNHFKFSTKQLITLINTFQSTAPRVRETREQKALIINLPPSCQNSDTFLFCLGLEWHGGDNERE